MSWIVYETKNRKMVMDETGHVFITDKNSPVPHMVLGVGWEQVKHQLEREEWLIKEGWL
ncbi:MAG: hypothetical protein IJV90_02570 [Candidatus Methanomethylophilaceae archaeon]|nr:hypothetical protein [Candidatus Methanomethylophilaceae archaeon]